MRDWNQMRDSIIGLGAESSRKSFYPELQQRLTQLEQAREDLRRSEANLWTVFNSMHDAIIVHDREGRILEVNDAMLTLYGVTRETFRRYTLEDYSDPTSNVHATIPGMRTIWNRLEREDHVLFEWNARRPVDGSLFRVEVGLRRAPWHDQQALLAVVRDVTERKRLEDMLSRSQRLDAIGQMAGGVAHDTNNMLGVILGYVDLLKDEPGLSDFARDGLARIRKAALQSSGLIRQLMTFARQQAIQPQPVDLNSLVEDTQKMLRRLIGENISLSWRPAPGLWLTFVDPSQIDQILANLAVNARDAIGAHGSITLASTNLVVDGTGLPCPDAVPGDYVRLSITDTGHGMSPEVQARVFDPFFTTKAPGRGTGLGLAMVYGIVKQSQGFITLESAPGAGSTFHLHFPRHGGAEAPSTGSEGEASAPGGQETILLVEDEESLIELERRTLEGAGYRVVAASHPLIAMVRLQDENGPVPLLVSGIVMPDLNGPELLERLRILHPGIKALFLSGYPGDAIPDPGSLGPGTDFLQKPFNRIHLLRRVRQLLDAPA